jgi:cyclopropane fatty-acyl-phospholipid synthase-like methyltransferase
VKSLYNQRILEIGCDDGSGIAYIVEYLSPLSGLGVNANELMVDKKKKKKNYIGKANEILIKNLYY